ncbi:MAG: hypothetical protein Q8Q14_02240 [Gemmatimonadales bacterium]|nr:hypothetical protein [Gemmatimonadales bacterium]
MDATEFVRQLPNFAAKNHPERIKAFGWFLHSQGTGRFTAVDIRRCYDDAHLDKPADMNRFLASLVEKRPPELLKDGTGYRLAQETRELLDRTLGKVEQVLLVEKVLTDLQDELSDEGERVFYDETIKCYRAGALRAAIVMTWNLAYDHLVRWVLADARRLDSFNAGIAKRNPKKAHVQITKREDFEELKEDETVDIVGNVPGITTNMKRILKEKLGRRNSYAHPSTLKIERAQVDDMITELVNNVVLRLQL